MFNCLVFLLIESKKVKMFNWDQCYVTFGFIDVFLLVHINVDRFNLHDKIIGAFVTFMFLNGGRL